MEAAYDEWNCTDELECTGACLATFQTTRDVRSQSTSSLTRLLTTRRSSLADVRVISPEDDQIQDVVDLAVPVEFRFPIDGDIDLAAYSLEVCCHHAVLLSLRPLASVFMKH